MQKHPEARFRVSDSRWSGTGAWSNAVFRSLVADRFHRLRVERTGRTGPETAAAADAFADVIAQGGMLVIQGQGAPHAHGNAAETMSAVFVIPGQYHALSAHSFDSPISVRPFIVSAANDSAADPCYPPRAVFRGHSSSPHPAGTSPSSPGGNRLRYSP